MMFVVDTNVLIYAANPDSLEHSRCRALLEQWRTGAAPWYTTWTILYEFIRVVTHPRVFPQPLPAEDALTFVEGVLHSPGHRVLVESESHVHIARDLLDDVPDLRGNLTHDFHTAVLMREHGVSRIYTRDSDFYRFGWVEVIDPLA
jgi:toxin-antitoxin system PIN domain toxin